jgi:DNA-binding FadR family transcriptional regulator
MERSADDNERFIEPDTDFHKTIVRSVENRMVDALGSVIEAALTISLRLSLDAPDGQRPSLPLHKKVLDAIRRRDRTGAARAMELLIDNAQQDALRALGAERVPPPKKRRSA